MLKRYFYQRERKLAYRDDNRIVRPFEWGKEFADPRFVDNLKNVSPQTFFENYSRNAVERSDEFFAVKRGFDFKSEIRNPKSEIRNPKSEIDVSWTSQIQTPSLENNTARARFFPVDKTPNGKRAVVILPHWNAPVESYVALCKVLNRVGIAALRLTLPYHERRRPPELERADYLVCPNLGLTLQSTRQAVLDTRAAVAWLKLQGFDRVGIVGTSIGSCTAFLAMVHDLNIDVSVFNHVSGYFADVVWRGISTYHVRQGFQNHITLDELRQYWLPVSPMVYMEKLKKLPPRPMRFIYALYDLSFPVDLSRETFAAFRQHGIKHEKTVIPCGHYTLGEPPWVYVDGWKIVNFLRKNL